MLPEETGGRFGFNTALAPPGLFVTPIMQFAVMQGAERHGPFIADFGSECAGLHEGQMMGLARLAVTDETGLAGDELQMALVALAARCPDGESGLVDSGHRPFGFGAGLALARRTPRWAGS